MKKFLLTLTVGLMLMVNPVSADAPFKLVVDNKPIDKPIVLIDNSAYVPIRAVADIFKADVDWNYQTKTITLHSKLIDPKTIKRPEIKGDAEFVEKITAALDLLEEKDFPDYWMVCENTEGIVFVSPRPESVSDITLSSYGSDGSIGFFPLITSEPKKYEPIFLAGILTHEACHATVRHYKNVTSEREAYNHELTTLKLLNAPQWMQDESLTLLKQL